MNHRSWKKVMAWRLFQAADLRSAAVLHATSQMEAGSLRALGLMHPIAVIANGVAVPPDDVGELWSERASIFPRTALFMSRIHPKKGLLDLVRAWRELRPPGWRVVIAGPDEGGHRAVVERAVREAGLQRDFVFVGAVRGDARLTLLRQSHLFVLPTHSENFGMVVAEALAYGIPVITTKGAPWRDLIDERCGWWTDVGAAPVARALREATLLTSSELRVLGARGRSHVERTYSWDRAADEMQQVYAWILDRGGCPDSILRAEA